MARALLGTRLREKRLELGVKQAAAAAAAGISPAYLNLIEHNRRAIGPEKLARIADALGLAPEDILGEDTGPVADALRAVAGGAGQGPGAAAPPLAEADLAEDLASRFPGWAALVLSQQARIDALNRSLEALNDRLSHDPHLSASLHEVLTAVASVRSTAGILAETHDLTPDWRAKFHRNLHQDSERLAAGAEALVDWLDSAGEPEAGGAISPQEEVETWAESHDWALASRTEAEIAALASTAARALARTWCVMAAADAEAMPEPAFAEAFARHGPDPARLADTFGVGLLAAMRRIAMRPGTPAGLVICDASGTPVFRKPLPGFVLPRFGAACPLWPLFTALSRPMMPVEAQAETLGAAGRRFLLRAFCEPRLAAGFDGPELRQAAMLILPEQTDSTAPALQIGASCRICPAADCPARREASVVG